MAASAVFLALSIPIAISLAGLFSVPITEDRGITAKEFSMANSLLQAVGIFLSPFVAKFPGGKYLERFTLFLQHFMACAYCYIHLL